MKSYFNIDELLVAATKECLISPVDLHAVGVGEVFSTFQCMTSPELSRVRSLNLSHNGLKELPAQVFRCKRLTSLDLTGNNLSALPVGFLRLPIVSLTIGKNHLKRSHFDAHALRLYFAEQFCQRGIICCTMIWRFRESVWGLLTRDLVRIIFRLLWSTRCDVSCWITEAAIECSTTECKTQSDLNNSFIIASNSHCCLQ